MVTGTPCGKHKRTASDEPAEGGNGGDSSGSSFIPSSIPQSPTDITNQLTGMLNFKPGGGNHNENENHSENSLTSFLPDPIKNQIGQDAPEAGRRKRSEGGEKPDENPLTSQLPNKEVITQLIQQFMGSMGNKGDKEEAHE